MTSALPQPAPCLSLSAVSPALSSAVSHALSAVSYGLSAVSHGLSAVRHGLSAASHGAVSVVSLGLDYIPAASQNCQGC